MSRILLFIIAIGLLVVIWKIGGALINAAIDQINKKPNKSSFSKPSKPKTRGTSQKS